LLPPAEERPEVVLAFGNGPEPEEFAPTRFEDSGTNTKNWRDLGVKDALVGTDVEGFS
jgi:iron complex transport system substrate-binding protein